MRQALKVKCYHCQDIFTLTAEMEADPPSANRVNVLVPCPFCDNDNQVTVWEDQIRAVTIHRGEGADRAVDLSQPGALLNQVFQGQAPTDS
jgi:hypothetical protein